MRNGNGFTIPEVVVSIVVMAVVFGALFTTFAAVTNYARWSMELRTGSLLLQEEVTRVRNLKFSEIKSLGANFTLGNMSLLRNCTGTIEKEPYEGRDEILKMTFRVNWQSFDNSPKEKEVVTLMTDHGINKK